jgi:uncharacterized protein
LPSVIRVQCSYTAGMSRIRKGYEAKFLRLLRSLGARRVDEGVRWLMARADCLQASGGLAESAALTQVHAGLLSQAMLRNLNGCAKAERFFCDAGLGGLARWLRGAGYEALWEAGIDDPELLRRAQETGTTLLTTDSMLMERRLLRDGIVPGLWLPPTLTIEEQLASVFREYNLSVREPRCMTCGGELRSGNKEGLRDRIPPRTYRWLDSFFVCTRCDKLFWHGTHWQRIRSRLEAIAGGKKQIR